MPKLAEAVESGNIGNMESQTDDENAETALATAWKFLRSGEFLNAYDVARRALNDTPGHHRLAHIACLALARSGATSLADRAYRDSGLESWASEDGISLRARIAKDMALAAADPSASPDLQRSIDAYKQGFDVDGGYYPAINTAFLYMLARDMPSTRKWAETALSAAGDEQSYYAEATRAEALLLLGDVTGAADAIRKAADLAAANPGEVSTTWKQLQLVCQHTGLSPEILAPLKPAPVVHFSGHIIAAPGEAGRFPADQEGTVRDALRTFFKENRVSRAFGSLAAGADILAAEAALEAGISLVVVLPFDADEFLQISVAGSGQKWLERHASCLEKASDVLFVTPDHYLGDDSLFGYATQFALGLARQQADWLQTDAIQIAVSDGRSGPSARAGTSHDMTLAAAAGFRQHIISVTSSLPVEQPSSHGKTASERSGRVPTTMIFGDLKGFSKLSDGQMPAFVEEVLGTMATCLQDFDQELLFRNTWGDGIYLVFEKPGDAARCGFALQDAVARVVASSAALPDTLGLRLGVHYGPVYEIKDPVMQTRNFFGSHVSHAARTEPRTPEGEIYVTAQTAAALALQERGRFKCDYVGRIPLAKNHGEFPMYHLKRA